MPHGKMLHTKLYEEADKLAVHKLAGLMAEEKMRKKHLKDLGLNNLGMSLREHIGKLIDKIEMDDLLNLAAVGTVAVIIQPVIKASPVIIDAVSKSGIVVGGLAWGIINLLRGETVQAEPLDDAISWLLSIGVACLIVKFGPEILKSAGGVVSLAGLLLA